MRAKNVAVGVAGGVLAVAVGATAVVGVQVHQMYEGLDHGQPFTIAEPEPVATPAGTDVQPVDMAALNATLEQLADNPALGTVHGKVIDTTTGATVWERRPADPLTPASSTKLLTTSAAILHMDPDKTLTTEVVAGPVPGSVVIRAAGDVWLTPERIDALAQQIPGPVTQVSIDTSVWSGDEYLPGWVDGNIDEGYIAPLQPAMIHGGRLGETTGDVPRSHTPAFDVAAELAARLGAETVAVGPAPEGTQVLATTESPTLEERIEQTNLHSDNVMAEAIGRELAIDRGAGNTPEAATRATLDTLREAGFDTIGTTLADNSGLSEHNLIAPRLLSDLVTAAATGDRLRPLLGTLPVAHGDGTLEVRYADLPGRGWVRAKTGTLTGTNALVGTVTAQSGRVYTFALLSNGSDILEGRQALDEFASALREH
ncbi:D-alanyl-D-alanine carboxypeptidase/D-alanyl-D-alanine endopeptidase [Corynebacterium doosanense]|uniref:D-alanyl-D-alanine carboxypeptidase n=1 Tax=Corynebacterium doosanense CAU 212 = DSM 45436 TaxID=558173 RepID=A0A097II99_9CORY|nr:D-alanyl-D-alanine carboxypeptidase/D-alanyl-D-alanine-endopeptidase [Corynebacterium doosanense]AIT61857.1 D-alanyl-D-alanine carboxypeptidase [Corynebacterium doosanense CAU 212 = DSM 45436]